MRSQLNNRVPNEYRKKYFAQTGHFAQRVNSTTTRRPQIELQTASHRGTECNVNSVKKGRG